MKDPGSEVVPEKLGSPINFRIVAVISGIVLGFHFLVNFLAELDHYALSSDALIYGFSMIIPVSVSLHFQLQDDMLVPWFIQKHT